MKLKLLLIGLALLVIYVLLPIGGSLLDKEGANKQEYKTFQVSSRLTPEDFIEQVESINNPETTYIVHPSTAIGMDGDNSKTGNIMLTSGWRRNTTNKMHGALDSDVRGDGTVLIAPVSGTILKIVSNYPNEARYYSDNVNSHNSYVAIKGTGLYEGRTFYVFHLVDIPDDLKPGDSIKQGDFIGTQNSQGTSTRSHTHFDVRSGGAKVSITEWLPIMTAHSSITNIVDLTPAPASKNKQGWTAEDIAEWNARPRYESQVVIPEVIHYN